MEKRVPKKLVVLSLDIKENNPSRLQKNPTRLRQAGSMGLANVNICVNTCDLHLRSTNIQ